MKFLLLAGLGIMGWVLSLVLVYYFAWMKGKMIEEWDNERKEWDREMRDCRGDVAKYMTKAATLEQALTDTEVAKIFGEDAP
jgi:hypothetical protein